MTRHGILRNLVARRRAPSTGAFLRNHLQYGAEWLQLVKRFRATKTVKAFQIRSKKHGTLVNPIVGQRIPPPLTAARNTRLNGTPRAAVGTEVTFECPRGCFGHCLHMADAHRIDHCLGPAFVSNRHGEA
jgi:hypothetical protein